MNVYHEKERRLDLRCYSGPGLRVKREGDYEPLLVTPLFYGVSWNFFSNVLNLDDVHFVFEESVQKWLALIPIPELARKVRATTNRRERRVYVTWRLTWSNPFVYE